MSSLSHVVPAVSVRERDRAAASARYHGDLFAIHVALCRTRQSGDACLRCDQLDLAAAEAEDRLLALDGGAS